MKKYGLLLFLVLIGLLIGVIYIQNYSIAVLIQGVKIQENSLYSEILKTQQYIASLLMGAILGLAGLLLGYTWLVNEKLVERKIDVFKQEVEINNKKQQEDLEKFKSVIGSDLLYETGTLYHNLAVQNPDNIIRLTYEIISLKFLIVSDRETGRIKNEITSLRTCAEEIKTSGTNIKSDVREFFVSGLKDILKKGKFR